MMQPAVFSLVTTHLAAAFPGTLYGVASSLESALRAVSTQAASAALTALWQGALLVFGLALCLRLAPRTSAAHRFMLWAAAFVALACLPVLALVSKFLSVATLGVAATAPDAAGFSGLQLDERWSVVIALIWAAATIVRGAGLAVHAFRLRKLWKSAVPIELEGANRGLLALANAAWGRGTVEVCTTTMLQRPSVIGFMKPRILIPDWLFAKLSAGELEQIVLHEAEHLRRRDDWTNLLQKICLVLFPLNPALVWIERRLGREREMACDDGVVRLTQAPRAYAACLASIAERGLERRAEALSLGAWQRRPELVHRVHSILRRKGALSPLETRALLGVMSCGLVLGAVELSRCPQLVSFVPESHVEANAGAAQSPAKVVNAAYLPAHIAEAVPTMLKPKARMSGSSLGPAIGSGRAEMVPVEANMSAQVGRGNEKRGGIRATETAFSVPDSLKEPSGKTDLRADEAKDIVPQQEWVVLTTWEQVTDEAQPATANAGLSADYEKPASPAAHGEAHAKTNQESGSRITVTRLILRVFPASAKTPQPGVATAMRDGWLVIQL